LPKLKTHSGTKKRIRVTKTGKIIRRHATGSHFLQKKSAARKRRIASTDTLSGKQAKNVRTQLGK